MTIDSYSSGAPSKVLHPSIEIGLDKARKKRAEARLRGEIPSWTPECLPKLYHNTPEGKRKNARKKREAYLSRPLVPAAVLPPDVHDPRAEEHQRRSRRDYVLEGLERGYPLREDPHDHRVFHTPAPLDGFLHIATKYLTPEQLEAARKPVFSGDIRYKPKEEDAIVVFSEPAPSTATPAAADSSSEEEDVLQVLADDDEVTGVAAALARSSLRVNQTKFVIKATRDPNGVGRGSTRGRERREYWRE
ncbi:hypothetical protein DAPPUDRAFT_248750 [Daphnia pulex]|uniref:Uncharacterized protein n=1 Tax=Daphnia pulex TaxID=6669 RepID=E9GV50_DAPPU|nr:hypothetical protein DAPPUDRAFT_248750 [Daphnia pulex]|eukprot:EFX76672.1 hypothetical protein DAPPUDRAFT_248750 [Daphnia pulex]